MANEVHVPFGQLVVEWQRDRPSGHRLANGEVTGLVPEPLDVEGLEMNGCEIVAATNSPCGEGLQDSVAVGLRVAVGQTHDEDKPAHVDVRRNFL